MKKTNRLKQRLDRLEGHLTEENPDLVEAVRTLRDMDIVAHRMGLLPEGESYANKISWWPLISILGTFSAGKSSFINSFLGEDIQKTGNQAVDDHFTVITYSRGAESQTLPGQALDSDPRFPFYRISEDLQEVIPGEGDKIDHYLQMKVVPSEVVKGKILIDSPGFDADEQRKSVLEITDHIIGLSDLVLVFFDGRHPEIGAMRDTLAHLVTPARDFKDADKFLFILNQIDTSAREDNLEQVMAAWRSALSAHGLSTGNFFVHFNDRLAVPVQDPAVWSRYTRKRDQDYAEIMKRIQNLDIHRTYRIVGKLKPLANDIENKAVPALKTAITEWRKNVFITDMVAFAVITLVTLLFMNAADKYLTQSDILFWLMVIVSIGGMVIAHFSARSFFSKFLSNKLKEESYGDMDKAFLKNTGGWRSIFFSNPTGYNMRARKILESVRNKSEAMIVSLNTKIANPSGKMTNKAATAKHKTAPVAKPTPAAVKEPAQASVPSVFSDNTKKEASLANQGNQTENIFPGGKSDTPSKPKPVNKDTSLHGEKIDIIEKKSATIKTAAKETTNTQPPAKETKKAKTRIEKTETPKQTAATLKEEAPTKPREEAPATAKPTDTELPLTKKLQYQEGENSGVNGVKKPVASEKS